jgi:hypothetical protein
MALSRSAKIRLVLAVLAVLLIVGTWQGLSYAWHRGYAHGIATGVVRKVSVHGPPYCKFLTGELVFQGSQAGQKPELFNFSVDDDHDSNPIVQQLKQAESSGTRVTLEYRQDMKVWWRCNPSEYFVTAVEK